MLKSALNHLFDRQLFLAINGVLPQQMGLILFKLWLLVTERTVRPCLNPLKMLGCGDIILPAPGAEHVFEKL